MYIIALLNLVYPFVWLLLLLMLRKEILMLRLKWEMLLLMRMLLLLLNMMLLMDCFKLFVGVPRLAVRQGRIKVGDCSFEERLLLREGYGIDIGCTCSSLVMVVELIVMLLMVGIAGCRRCSCCRCLLEGIVERTHAADEHRRGQVHVGGIVDVRMVVVARTTCSSSSTQVQLGRVHKVEAWRCRWPQVMVASMREAREVVAAGVAGQRVDERQAVVECRRVRDVEGGHGGVLLISGKVVGWKGEEGKISSSHQCLFPGG